MIRKIFKSKIHRAVITEADIDYNGSLTIDSNLMEAADILENEAVHVWNISNGSRLLTYALKGKAGSGSICLNGSAARLGHVGDLVIITTFADMTTEEAKKFKPTVVLVSEGNKIGIVSSESTVIIPPPPDEKEYYAEYPDYSCGGNSVTVIHTPSGKSTRCNSFDDISKNEEEALSALKRVVGRG